MAQDKTITTEELFGRVITTEELFGKYKDIITTEELTNKDTFGKLRSPKETLKLFSDIFPVKERYFGVIPKRPLQIMGEEFVGGIKDVGQALKEEYESDYAKEKPLGYAGFRSPQQALRAGKVGMGVLRSAWSPVTGITRAWFGEPTEKLATKAGASPTLAKVLGIGAEVAPQVLAPAGAARKTIGKAFSRLAYGPKEVTTTKEWPLAVRKLHGVLKEAIPVRAEQAAMYSEALGKRVGAVAGIGKGKLTGKAKYYAQLKQLKGKLPKLEETPWGAESRAYFKSVARKIDEKDVDELLELIENVKHLSPLEKIAGKKGLLEEILAPHTGVVPTRSTIRILSEAFPQEFIKNLLDKRSVFQKMTNLGIEAINVPRTIMASTDLSAAFRQGIFAGPRHPILFAKSFGSQFKYAFSRKAYRNLIEKIHKNPNFVLAKEKGLAFTELGGLAGEEAYMGAKIAEKIPFAGRIIKGSNRAYTGFLNKFRMDLFDDFIRRNPNIVKNAKGMKQLTAYLNAATGRGNLKGSLKKAGPLLNGVLFSPRLMASRLKLLNPGYYLNPKLHPAIRREALQTLFSFTATGLSMLGLASLIPGAKVGLDPRSADFGKIKMGNTRFDIWGGFQQYIRALAQIRAGKMISSTTGREYTLGEGYKPTTKFDVGLRFMQSKQNPILSLVTDAFKGTTFIGEEFEWGPEIINRMVPMVVQDMYDLYKEGGLKDVPWATPAIFGVGVQTYGRQIPRREYTPSGKPTIKLHNVPGMGEDIMNVILGRKASNIPESQHERIIKTKQREAEVKYRKAKRKQERQKHMKERLERLSR